VRLICYIIKSRAWQKEKRPQAQTILRIRHVALVAVDRTHLFGFCKRVLLLFAFTRHLLPPQLLSLFLWHSCCSWSICVRAGQQLGRLYCRPMADGWENINMNTKRAN